MKFARFPHQSRPWPDSFIRLQASPLLHSLPLHLSYARFIFDHLESPNVHLYTAMITAYSSHSDHTSALLLYRSMVRRPLPLTGSRPNQFIYPHVLKSCTQAVGLESVRMVHSQVLKSGFGQHPVVQTSLLDAYLRFSSDVGSVRFLFDEMTERNVVSWTAMIYGYMRLGQIGNAVLLFEEMPDRNVPSWNAVIAGYTQNGLFTEAISLFRRMIFVEEGAQGRKNRPNQSVEEAECRRAYDSATEFYMSAFDRTNPPEEAALIEAHDEAKQKSLAAFNANAVGAGPTRQKYEKLLQNFFRKAFEGDDPVYSDPRVRPRTHFESSFPVASPGGMDEDISRLRTTAVSLLSDLGCNGSTLTEDLINEMCRFGAAELHAVAAFIGGIPAQEVIKDMSMEVEVAFILIVGFRHHHFQRIS